MHVRIVLAGAVFRALPSHRRAFMPARPRTPNRPCAATVDADCVDVKTHREVRWQRVSLGGEDVVAVAVHLVVGIEEQEEVLGRLRQEERLHHVFLRNRRTQAQEWIQK
eukprot:3797219-Pleurochrysis_carterae.AAC.1